MVRLKTVAVSLTAACALLLHQGAAVASPADNAAARAAAATAEAGVAAAVREAQAARAAALARAADAAEASRASATAAAAAAAAAGDAAKALAAARAAAAAARASAARARAEAAEEERLDSELGVGLTVIENIPDELENDEAAAQAYLNREFAAVESKIGSSGSAGQVRAFSSTWSCVSAVVIALASNVFTVSKIFKIKRIVKAAGGVKKVVKKIRAEYKEARKAKYSKFDAVRYGVMESVGGLGTEAVSLLLSFFSLDKVWNNCF